MSINRYEGNTPVNRRTALAQLSAFATVAGWPESAEVGTSDDKPGTTPAVEKRVRKIATEEAFMIPEIALAVRELVQRGGSNRNASSRLMAPKLLNLDTDSPADGGSVVTSVDMARRVAARLRWHGTHNDTFMKTAPLGNRIDGVSEIVFYRLENEKIVERWTQLDLHSLFKKMKGEK